MGTLHTVIVVKSASTDSMTGKSRFHVIPFRLPYVCGHGTKPLHVVSAREHQSQTGGLLAQ